MFRFHCFGLQLSEKLYKEEVSCSDHSAVQNQVYSYQRADLLLFNVQCYKIFFPWFRLLDLDLTSAPIKCPSIIRSRLILVNTMRHTVELISTLKNFGHTIFPTTVFNIGDPRNRLQYFYWIEIIMHLTTSILGEGDRNLTEAQQV